MSTSQTKKLTVLLAEDHELTRILINDLLLKNGFRVLEAANGKEAIDIYNKQGSSIAAVVSDLRMPEVGGVEFARYNYSKRQLPFVVCTGIDDSSLALELLNYGVQDYVVKPDNIESVALRAKHAISRYISLNCGLDKSRRLQGNVGSVSIVSRKKSLPLVIEWAKVQIEKIFNENEATSFLIHLNEFLLNAHEHGNLGLSEYDKTTLMESGELDAKILDMEQDCSASIRIEMSVLKNEISVKVKDDGKGFDYKKHLRMTEEELVDRILMPNGRGILMCSKYFNSIVYSDSGATVQLLKNIERPQ